MDILSKDIAEILHMPQYHNSKAVYQKYMGWYDANPANLNPLSPVAESKKIVEYMGGAEAVLKRAHDDYAKGEFRWVASVTSKAVYANPGNIAARELCADALEQLGYQSEASTWRNAYLLGSLELRHGPQRTPVSAKRATISAVSNELMFDYLAIRVNATNAEGKHIILNWNFTDSKERFVVTLENSEADATVNLDRPTLNSILASEITTLEAQNKGKLVIEGNKASLDLLISLLDEFDELFPIVEPRV
ncbi:Alkyl/aryl-sulfatase BDS1 [Lachancea thermotolerans]